jgi:hypothetical protein
VDGIRFGLGMDVVLRGAVVDGAAVLAGTAVVGGTVVEVVEVVDAVAVVVDALSSEVVDPPPAVEAGTAAGASDGVAALRVTIIKTAPRAAAVTASFIATLTQSTGRWKCSVMPCRGTDEVVSYVP